MAIGQTIERGAFQAALDRARSENQSGDYNIAYHYTDYWGALRIGFDQMIRADARNRTYFTFEQMGPLEARDRLFAGGVSNPHKGSFVIIFLLEVGYPMSVDPSTTPVGFYATGPIRNGRGAYFVYGGQNYFPNDPGWQ
ncbi:MAG: hypothetical protein AB7F85_08280 [Hyphomonadaceae bacterium]